MGVCAEVQGLRAQVAKVAQFESAVILRRGRNRCQYLYFSTSTARKLIESDCPLGVIICTFVLVKQVN